MVADTFYGYTQLPQRNRRRILASVFVRQWRSIPLFTYGLLNNAPGNRREIVVFAWAGWHDRIIRHGYKET